MLNESNLYDYQNKIAFHQSTCPTTMIWAEMGLGKTVSTLTAANNLLNSGWLRGILIVAPIRVCRLVWRREAAKWAHLQHMTFSMVLGSAQQRLRALMDPSKKIFIINYENLSWLSTVLQDYYINRSKPIPFDGIVWDEISKMKNSQSKRAKHFKKVIHHFKWRTGLTGTPASNGYKDLHGQYLVVDDGYRLGQGKTKFLTRYYWKDGFKMVAFPNAENEIKEAISDITLEMSAADYNPLPDMIVNDVEIELTGKFKEEYESLERDFFLQLDSGQEIELFNKASLLNKLLQYSNGAVYVEPGKPEYETIHDLKLDALEEIVDGANGQPILCAYAYKSDAERIMKKFKKLRPINLTQCKSAKALQDAMDRWQAGDCPLMIGHPACLHPKTEVLTELRGWVKIIDVKKDERVFDGVEFVEHDGCSYSGYKDVMDVFGITMTPNHKLLINDKWVEGQHVRDCKKSRNEAIFQWEETFDSDSEMFELWERIRNDDAERQKAQQEEEQILSTLRKRILSLHDQHPNMEYLVRNEEQMQESEGQRLWWSGNKGLSRMERLQEFLQRYVRNLSRRPNSGTDRCERSIFERELQVGDDLQATIKQEKQSIRNISERKDSFGGACEKVRFQQDDVKYETEQGNDRRRSSTVMQKFNLREKAHVYDLVNCGPRNRFLIRNDEGECFISHNSMGHGIDGLQDSGNILVWFGLTWSLDLYDQFNARLRRQGQGAPVVCHRIYSPCTADSLQNVALSEKGLTEESLKRAVKEYRIKKSLTINP